MSVGETYARRVPEATVLYRVVQQYFGEFLAQVEAGDREGRLPAFVKEEFEAYLGTLGAACTCGASSAGTRWWLRSVAVWRQTL